VITSTIAVTFMKCGHSLPAFALRSCSKYFSLIGLNLLNFTFDKYPCICLLFILKNVMSLITGYCISSNLLSYTRVLLFPSAAVLSNVSETCLLLIPIPVFLSEFRHVAWRSWALMLTQHSTNTQADCATPWCPCKLIRELTERGDMVLSVLRINQCGL